MTEAEWLTSVNGRAMIAEAGDKGSERLWRLFAVAGVRAVAAPMPDVRSRDALDVAERFADGMATREELRAARVEAEEAAFQAAHDEWEDEVRTNFRWDAAYEAVCVAKWAADLVPPCLADELRPESIPECVRLPDLLREIFGNPFRWLTADPLWLAANDGAARRLGESIYDDRSFDLLPILADALEDAGCADADILGHLRGEGAHVRGCWALDLILGKG